MKNAHKKPAAQQQTNFVRAQFQDDSRDDGSHSSKRYSALAIIGLIFAVGAPLIGLIISIIAWKKINPEIEKGQDLAMAGIIVGGILFLLTILSLLIDPSLINELQKTSY